MMPANGPISAYTYKRRADETELDIAQPELGLQHRKHRKNRLPVGIVKKADEPEQENDKPFVGGLVHGAVSD
jgi:hypothetical protein